MDRLVIRGGIPLRGEVRVSGAKNSVLPLMASAILAEGPCRFSNCPGLKDVETMGRVLEHLGVSWSLEGDEIVVDASGLSDVEAPYHHVRTMRASVLVLGPLLARMGRARVSLPGGCAIGARPIDQHLKGLGRMGAEIRIERGYVEARARRLRGGRILFDMPTVTGTENLMMAAALAEGETVLENAACEPEIGDLADALRSMGVAVEGDGTSRIRIQGCAAPRPIAHRVIPDRIETGTLMAAAGITGGEILIRGARPDHLEAVIEKLVAVGLSVSGEAGALRVRSDGALRAVDIKTMPHPGFPTDMQAQLMALLSLAEGTSVITETIFENRYMHVAELDRLGADIRVDGAVAQVRGVRFLTGAPVMATDLRASASLVLAGLAARGETHVRRIYHLDRGYDRLEEKLAALGADIVREKEDAV